MQDLSLHILDIAENSVSAGASLVKISLVEDTVEDLLSMEIDDNGKGMPSSATLRATDPFYTTRTTRNVGLGLALLDQSAREAGGSVSVRSKEGQGTSVTASFRHSHIDRKPLGDIVGTLIVLIAGNPGVDFVFCYHKNSGAYCFDTRPVREELEDVPLNAPAVISALREELTAGLRGLDPADATNRQDRL